MAQAPASIWFLLSFGEGGRLSRAALRSLFSFQNITDSVVYLKDVVCFKAAVYLKAVNLLAQVVPSVSRAAIRRLVVIAPGSGNWIRFISEHTRFWCVS